MWANIINLALSAKLTARHGLLNFVKKSSNNLQMQFSDHYGSTRFRKVTSTFKYCSILFEHETKRSRDTDVPFVNNLIKKRSQRVSERAFS